MLLRGYSIKVLPCLADLERIRIEAELTDDISEVLPYLNATFRQSVYNKDAQNLTLKKDGRQITFHGKKIAITKLEDENAARDILDELRDLINRTYSNRGDIQPKYDNWLVLTPLSLSSSLPGEKCEDCPAEGCYDFAEKLINGDICVVHCSPLFTSRFQKKRERVMSLLKQAGYDIPSEFL